MSLSGSSRAQKKDGSVYYRSSITFRNKHISLGSFPTEEEAHECYLEAARLLSSAEGSWESFSAFSFLSHDKFISLLNFRNNHIYIKTPIYLQKRYFQYFLTQSLECKFDIDDLFYFSEHKIMKRGNHLFVSDYGMQVTITSRYGIRPHSVIGRDFLFRNGDPYDFRYENLEIINPYHGVERVQKNLSYCFRCRIHVNGYLVVGYFPDALEAAIAYNKAADFLNAQGIQREYFRNYISELRSESYWKIYEKIQLPESLKTADIKE